MPADQEDCSSQSTKWSALTTKVHYFKSKMYKNCQGEQWYYWYVWREIILLLQIRRMRILEAKYASECGRWKITKLRMVVKCSQEYEFAVQCRKNKLLYFTDIRKMVLYANIWNGQSSVWRMWNRLFEILWDCLWLQEKAWGLFCMFCIPKAE